MEYRRLGRTGLEVSAISLGTEYLINRPREHVVSVIREAIARGIRYFDLFFAQPEFRDNMGAAFAGYREQVWLAAHLGATWTNGQSDRTRDPKVARQFLDDFLRRYQTDYVDFLYLHNCDEPADYDQIMRPGGLKDVALEFKAQGKARYIGFSSHTSATALRAVESGLIDVLMFSVNMVGHAIPGKREMLTACATHDVGVVAMKPYAGGKLLQEQALMDMMHFQTGGPRMQLTRPYRVTPVQCLAYVLAQQGISTIVPGCKNLEELDAALAYFQASEAEREFGVALADFQQYVEGECCYCNHCLPCPQTIDIGQTNRLLDLAQHGVTPAIREIYAGMPTNASDCIQCGACEERCPFGVQVIDRMEQAAALLG